MQKMNALSEKRGRACSEDGSATIEVVMWLPVFLLVFSLAFDVAIMFVAESEAVRVVQDANRLTSIGRLESASDTETFIETNLQHLSTNVAATSTVNSSGVLRSVVTFPSTDLQTIGRFPGLNSVQITVAAEHLIEDFN